MTTRRDSSDVTLRDIAREVGVSVATVSQALSGKGRISREKRQRILELVQSLGYTPNKDARSMANRRASRVVPLLGGRRRRLVRPVWYGGVEELAEYVRLEARQRHEEGCDLSSLEPDLKRALEQGGTESRLRELYAKLLDLQPTPGYPFIEPDGLEAIRANRTSGPRRKALVMPLDVLFDRIHGAWLGRCCGCLLGKPIEAGWPRTKVQRYLELAGAYPLRSYVPLLVPLPKEFELNVSWQGTVLGQIDGMVRDDDTDYTVLNLGVLERYGLRFRTEDVATAWMSQLPYFQVYTAERIAYRNLVHNILPPASAAFCNPCREFIGARIRADVFGYVSPGLPELAAELAYRDAILSHTRNGVYTAMQTAAMISWAFVSDDVREIVSVGLSEIPADSRAAALTRTVLDLHSRERDWAAAHDILMSEYGSYHPVHALNNMGIVLLALLYGGGDFGRTITIAVMCGLDTDSNGATAGSIVGLLNGAGRLPAHWTEALKDQLPTALTQSPALRISDLARRTLSLAQSVLAGAWQDAK